MARQPETARAEFAIAAAGPATSLVIAAVTAVLAVTLGGANEKVEAIFG